MTNHTGRTHDGKPTIDVLFHAPGVTLVKLFSPEHGIRGEVDAAVPDGKDEATGLPIISLYGKDRKPRAKDLEGIDALVYDIQDIGARFYTYITTLGLVLEAAKESRTRRCLCSTGPIRSAAWRLPGRFATRSSPRSSPTMRCRSGTG